MNPIPSVRVVLTAKDHTHRLIFNAAPYFNGIEIHELQRQLETNDQRLLQNIALGMSRHEVLVNHFLAAFAISKTNRQEQGFDTKLNRDDLSTYLEFRQTRPGDL